MTGIRTQRLAVCDECGTPRVVVVERDGVVRPLSGGGDCRCGSDRFTLVEGDDVRPGA